MYEYIQSTNNGSDILHTDSIVVSKSELEELIIPILDNLSLYIENSSSYLFNFATIVGILVGLVSSMVFVLAWTSWR